MSEKDELMPQQVVLSLDSTFKQLGEIFTQTTPLIAGSPPSQESEMALGRRYLFLKALEVILQS